MLRAFLIRPEGLLVATFAGLILLGGIVLRLPICHAQGPVPFIDTLFTSTSAVCVTGLITVDTATAYSRTGQTVIMFLIQIGGLGIMTFAAIGAQFLRRRLSFSSHAAWQSAFFDGPVRRDLRRALVSIFVTTFAFEALGAALIYAGLHRYGTPRGGAFEAVFLGVSAFCNAGFAVYSDNVVGLRDSNLVMFPIMGLIVAGGLGYTVWLEVLERLGRRIRRTDGPLRWTLHTRVVLRVTTLLAFGGAALLVLTGLTTAEKTLSEKLINALFQSVSARTAGFNSIDVGAMPMASLLLLTGLMYIGGSPGSCAGGIKTTTAAVWLARVRARLAGRESVTIAGRTLPQDVVRKAALVLAVASLWNLVGVMILALSAQASGAHLEQLVFEQISAFGTVGLSANAGSNVSLSALFPAWAKFWIIATMYVGRVGPLTLALAAYVPPAAPYAHPPERVMIG